MTFIVGSFTSVNKPKLLPYLWLLLIWQGTNKFVSVRLDEGLLQLLDQEISTISEEYGMLLQATCPTHLLFSLSSSTEFLQNTYLL